MRLMGCVATPFKPLSTGSASPLLLITHTFYVLIGLTNQEILEHYPQLTVDDVHAALAYAAELAKENVWKVAGAGE